MINVTWTDDQPGATMESCELFDLAKVPRAHAKEDVNKAPLDEVYYTEAEESVL